MSSALDKFGQTLVKASQRLHAEELDAAPVTPTVRARRRGPVRRFRSRSLAVQFAVVAAAVTVFAGAAASYSIFRGGAARNVPSYDCIIPGDPSDTFGEPITGSPITDCTTQWPQGTHGKSTAPPLTIWGPDNGKPSEVAVKPAGTGPPAYDEDLNWKRLPDSWTVNLPATILADQLNNIGPPLNPQLRYGCSYAAADLKAVRSLIQKNGFKSWTVSIRPLPGSKTPTPGCHPTSTLINGHKHNVLLIQNGASTGDAATHTTPVTSQDKSQAKYLREYLKQANLEIARIQRIYDRVNATLNQRCESVSDAAALWTRAARKAGLTPATLAYWRPKHAPSGQNLATLFKHYTLYKQPASQHTGKCAHILAMVKHEGIATIYAAKITP